MVLIRIFLMTLSIFPCADGSFVYLLWRNICSDPLPIFKLGYLSFSSCKRSFHTLDTSPSLVRQFAHVLCSQSFSPRRARFPAWWLSSHAPGHRLAPEACWSCGLVPLRAQQGSDQALPLACKALWCYLYLRSPASISIVKNVIFESIGS